MATKRPSFLKRQKELNRTARAAEKREARRQKKVTREAQGTNEPELDEMGDEVTEEVTEEVADEVTE